MPSAFERQSRRELTRGQSFASIAADTEEAGVRWHWESSTCGNELVAVNRSRPLRARGAPGNSTVTDAELETLEHASEVFRVPAVTKY